MHVQASTLLHEPAGLDEVDLKVVIRAIASELDVTMPRGPNGCRRSVTLTDGAFVVPRRR